MSISQSPANSLPAAAPATAGWGLLILNWLVPGAGFMIAGRGGRGLAQMLIVLTTFAIGLTLRGGVVWPVWIPGREGEFNLINNITFIIQMGGGLPALLSLAGSLCESLARSGPAAGIAALFGGFPEHPYFELGSYYLVVAGALNYFATCNFHDRLVRPQPRFSGEPAAPATARPAPAGARR